MILTPGEMYDTCNYRKNNLNMHTWVPTCYRIHTQILTYIHTYIFSTSHRCAGWKDLDGVIEETGIKSILLIYPEWLDKILYHSKRAELRTKTCAKREPIGLGWRGRLHGVIDLVDCIEISQKWKEENVHLHKVADPSVYERFNYAWLLGKKVQIAENLIEFEQPNGSIVWVTPRKKRVTTPTSSQPTKQNEQSDEGPTTRIQAPDSCPVHLLRLGNIKYQYISLNMIFFYATSAWIPTTLQVEACFSTNEPTYLKDFKRHIIHMLLK